MQGNAEDIIHGRTKEQNQVQDDKTLPIVKSMYLDEQESVDHLNISAIDGSVITNNDLKELSTFAPIKDKGGHFSNVKRKSQILYDESMSVIKPFKPSTENVARDMIESNDKGII